MARHITIAVLSGAAVLAATGIYFGVSHHGAAPQMRRRADVMATVTPDTQFRIIHRRPENNGWDDGSPFDHTTALVVLHALATGTPWDVDGNTHPVPPALALTLAWCKGLGERAQSDKRSITICYGNTLFWYGPELYELSQEGHQVLDRVFPKNH